MANTSNSAAKKKTAAPKTETKAAEAKSSGATKAKRKAVKLTDRIRVVSCFYGELFYRNPYTGFSVKWDKFGSDAFLTVEELMAMRNGQRAFFENQWIMLVDDNIDAVIEFLQLEQYYQNITSIQDIEALFQSPVHELPGVLARFSPAAKETIAQHAYSMIQDRRLTDINVIKALEETLGYDLTH